MKWLLWGPHARTHARTHRRTQARTHAGRQAGTHTGTHAHKFVVNIRLRQKLLLLPCLPPAVWIGSRLGRSMKTGPGAVVYGNVWMNRLACILMKRGRAYVGRQVTWWYTWQPSNRASPLRVTTAIPTFPSCAFMETRAEFFLYQSQPTAMCHQPWATRALKK